MNVLYERINYSSNLPFVFSRYIREYDIQKANISILFDKGIISQQDYEYLYNSDRMERQIYIGKLQRSNKKITKALQSGIINAKKNLFLSNKIEPHEVLAIKNDAVFIIGRELTNTQFGIIKFVEKNVYTSFMRLQNVEIYYGFDRISNTENYSIKGLGKKEFYHRDYMIDFLLYIINSIQTTDIQNVIIDLGNFYREYINRLLPIGYYREFNSDSRYKIGGFIVDDIPDTIDNRNAVDISYNARILTILSQYVNSIYMNNAR